MKRLRKAIASWLVRMARRIDPACQEALQFYTDRMLALAITGQSVIKISAVDSRDLNKPEVSR